MSDPTFRLASNIDVNQTRAKLESTDLPVIARLEQAFGREPFTVSEAQDVIDNRDSFKRLRNARIVVLVDRE